ncbi:MAG: M48 family metallopeptidase [Candidatus Bathyarchaeia archaeon]
MKQLTIFGQQHLLQEKKSDKDAIERRSNTIIVNKYQKTTKTLLREFLAQLLCDKLLEIYDSIKAEGKVELFGDFDFEITENIDGKKSRIAKLKGNKVIIKLNAVALPESALKYIVAHEIGHTTSKRHTSKFWKTVGLIYPDYKKAQKLLNSSPLNLIQPQTRTITSET